MILTFNYQSTKYFVLVIGKGLTELTQNLCWNVNEEHFTSKRRFLPITVKKNHSVLKIKTQKAILYARRTSYYHSCLLS